LIAATTFMSALCLLTVATLAVPIIAVGEGNPPGKQGYRQGDGQNCLAFHAGSLGRD